MRELTPEELRATQMEILRSVSAFCGAEGIRYYLGFGTLLGAVRHRGYIPWDDDIDISMPRKDFEAFCESFTDRYPFKEHSLYTHRSHPEFPYPFAKVGSDATLLEEDLSIPVTMGVNIDIFPIDGWPEHSLYVKLHRLNLSVLRKLLEWKILRHPAGRGMRGLIGGFLMMGLDAIPTARLLSGLSRCAVHYAFDESEHVGVLVWAYRERVPRSAYGTPQALMFEGQQFAGPCNPDIVLRSIYDDYMTLPPEDKRATHHAFKAYTIDG